MVKSARDLKPGDIVNLDTNTPKVITAMHDKGNKILVLLETGDQRPLHPDTQVFVYDNADDRRVRVYQEQLEATRRQAEHQAARQLRDRELVEQGRRDAEFREGWGHTPSLRSVNGKVIYK